MCVARRTLVSASSGTELLPCKDTSYSRRRLQGPAAGLLTYFRNKWEWQEVLPAFHFSYHTPWFNRERWTETGAMCSWDLLLDVFSIFLSRMSIQPYSAVSLFISDSSFPVSTFKFFSSGLIVNFSFSTELLLFTLVIDKVFFINYISKQLATVSCTVTSPTALLLSLHDNDVHDRVTLMDVVLQNLEMHTLANSVNNTCSFSTICVFDVTSMCMENDVMPRETLSMVIWEIFFRRFWFFTFRLCEFIVFRYLK